MSNQGPRLSRREFIGGSAALAAIPAPAAPSYTKIYLPAGGELPLETAATELASKTGAKVVR
ncbi:MAG: hypothetical protein GY953_25485, partial [bacterium]|nr:hypothetical protein [bacterium]